jgi:hypothetical protein
LHPAALSALDVRSILAVSRYPGITDFAISPHFLKMIRELRFALAISTTPKSSSPPCAVVAADWQRTY